MPSILLCCHEDDGFGTQVFAERLLRHLSRLLGSGVGLIVATPVPGEAVAPGSRGAEALSADVLVVFVGPDFNERVRDDRDLVRRAIETAFERGAPVVPVVDPRGGAIPGPHDLPPMLAKFGELLQFPDLGMSYAGNEADNARMVERIRGALGVPGRRSPPADAAATQARSGTAAVDIDSLPEPSAKVVRASGTGAAAFVGPTVRAPAYGRPWPLRSYDQFRQDFGDPAPSGGLLARVALSAKAYFDNGGELLYVSRVLGTDAARAAAQITGLDDGRFEYRLPGGVGNGVVVLTRVSKPATWRSLQYVPCGTVVQTEKDTLYEKRDGGWYAESGAALSAGAADVAEKALEVPAWFVTLSVTARDGAGREQHHDDLALSPRHPRWIGAVMASCPATSTDIDGFAVRLGPGVGAFEIDRALLASPSRDDRGRPVQRLEATGGSDGTVTAEAYAIALDVLDDVDAVEVVAAPGSGALPDADYRQIQDALVAHAENSQRLAVLELPPECTPDQALAIRADFESTRAAFFYPWLSSAGDEGQQGPPLLPPTGFVCGVLARTGVSIGLPRPVTNERLRGAVRPATRLGVAGENALVPLGVNCVRLFSASGCRLRGGRVAAAGASLRFVNLRRYVDHVGRSIAHGMGWTLFEPNDEQTWTQVRSVVSAFLRQEWRSGRLIGNNENEAYFVQCGTETMRSEDIDNGRLICLVRLAAADETPCRLEITVGPAIPAFREIAVR